MVKRRVPAVVRSYECKELQLLESRWSCMAYGPPPTANAARGLQRFHSLWLLGRQYPATRKPVLQLLWPSFSVTAEDMHLIALCKEPEKQNREAASWIGPISEAELEKYCHSWLDHSIFGFHTDSQKESPSRLIYALKWIRVTGTGTACLEAIKVFEHAGATFADMTQTPHVVTVRYPEDRDFPPKIEELWRTQYPVERYSIHGLEPQALNILSTTQAVQIIDPVGTRGRLNGEATPHSSHHPKWTFPQHLIGSEIEEWASRVVSMYFGLRCSINYPIIQCWGGKSIHAGKVALVSGHVPLDVLLHGSLSSATLNPHYQACDAESFTGSGGSGIGANASLVPTAFQGPMGYLGRPYPPFRTLVVTIYSLKRSPQSEKLTSLHYSIRRVPGQFFKYVGARRRPFKAINFPAKTNWRRRQNRTQAREWGPVALKKKTMQLISEGSFYSGTTIMTGYDNLLLMGFFRTNSNQVFEISSYPTRDAVTSKLRKRSKDKSIVKGKTKELAPA
ncbi:hypothetical protein L218DRAFT_988309 [Marasmius fiardii PR-910]|nr:hypothetical protein L218DRAFT_988309 [Marasmius fiardii PR-910]